MKQIIIIEHQLSMLKENDASPDIEDGDIQEYCGHEISTTATVHDNEGSPKYGKMHDTDQLGNFLTNQNWWLSGSRRNRGY